MYMKRFVFRCLCFGAALALLIFCPEQYDVMYGFNFFRGFSFFHILWVIWLIDMALQLMPCRKYLPIGSQKFHVLDRLRIQPLKIPLSSIMGKGGSTFLLSPLDYPPARTVGAVNGGRSPFIYR